MRYVHQVLSRKLTYHARRIPDGWCMFLGYAAFTTAKCTSAPGPGRITYSALSHLGHEAGVPLLEYFNTSRTRVTCHLQGKLAVLSFC